MAVTIYDIAKKLNISAMTVSRVFSNSKSSSVSASTRERVLKTANEMGYRPNQHARALITGKTNTVALWISHLHSSIYTQIVQAIQSHARRDGFYISLYETNWHFAQPGYHYLMDWSMDGILAIDPPDPPELVRMLGDPPRNIPRVNLGSGQGVMWPGDWVHVDVQNGVREAIRHLINSGCKRIVYSILSGLCGVGHLPLGNYAPYAEVMNEANFPVEIIAQEVWDLASIRNQTRLYIRAHGKPDAIFCHNDEVAIATFRALRDLEYRVPEDVLLIGCEGNEFMDYFDPPLSTIQIPTQELAQSAWSLLLKRIENADAPIQGISLPHKLMLRRSSERQR